MDLTHDQVACLSRARAFSEAHSPGAPSSVKSLSCAGWDFVANGLGLFTTWSSFRRAPGEKETAS